MDYYLPDLEEYGYSAKEGLLNIFGILYIFCIVGNREII